MRTKSYAARAAFLRHEDDSWSLRCFCECKNGRSSRCSHAVALLMLASHSQHPGDIRFPWNAQPPARPILMECRLIKKRAAANSPLSGPLERPVQSKRRRTSRCGLCDATGHDKTSCPVHTAAVLTILLGLLPHNAFDSMNRLEIGDGVGSIALRPSPTLVDPQTHLSWSWGMCASAPIPCCVSLTSVVYTCM